MEITARWPAVLVGVDFDNTIVCYDRVFHDVAVARRLVPAELPIGKATVRDYLRRRGQEEAWTELQGYVYGSCMRRVAPFPGAVECFRQCRRNGIGVRIISHKTRRPFRGPTYDLHRGAHAWLEEHGFYDPSGIGLDRRDVFFEPTKQAKLVRIAEAGCSCFVDDLPEFLTEPAFPEGVQRILFDPNGQYDGERGLLPCTSWAEIARVIACRQRLRS